MTKTQIMLAGIGMNLVTAFLLLTISALVGMPRIVDNQFAVSSDTKITRQKVLVTYVEPGSPAAKAGLQPRDTLTGIGPANALVPVSNADTLPAVTKELAGQTVSITYVRDDAAKTAQVALRSTQEVEASRKTDNPKGYLGISPSEYTIRRSTWSAPIVALGVMKQITALTFKGIGAALGGLFHGNTKQASEQVSGPVGIFVVFREGSHLGYEFILLLVGLISLTLAIMNVLPIPALDGGRLFVTLLFRLFHKPLKENVEDLIHGSGFAVLMLLFVLITFVDIHRFF